MTYNQFDIPTIIALIACLLAILIINYLFLKSPRISGKTGLHVVFDEKTRIHLQNIKQRCEHSDELVVIRKAIACYDTLTQAVTEGETIVLIAKNGEKERLELFPIDDED